MPAVWLEPQLRFFVPDRFVAFKTDFRGDPEYESGDAFTVALGLGLRFGRQ